VELFQWSLYAIDQTDIESLIPFVFHYPQWKERIKHGPNARRQELFADDADWL